MTTLDIATKLVSMIRTGQFETIYTDLFSPDARNIEAIKMGDWDVITT
jgi:hypothetical protein